MRLALLARLRHVRAVRAFARRCARVVDAFENANDYSFETNGEARVLHALAARGAKRLFDVGAHVGDWASLARRLVPQAEIHCFEIVPETFALLERRLGREPGFVLNGFGLGSEDGEATVRHYPDASALSTTTAYPHGREWRELRARVRAGDSYLRERGLDLVDLVKIDAEGAEPRILDGFASALERRSLHAVQFEYGQVSILTRFLLRDFHELFEARGYRVGRLYPLGVEFRDYAFTQEDFRGGNFLAVRADRDDLVKALRPPG